MHQHLAAQREIPRDDMRVGVAEQQARLEEYEAGVPHPLRTAQPGQRHPREQRLDPEQQKGRGKQRHSKYDKRQHTAKRRRNRTRRGRRNLERHIPILAGKP